MFVWLLRLFPEYRMLRDVERSLLDAQEEAKKLTDALESETSDVVGLRDAVNELVTEKRILEAQLEAAEKDKEHLWTVMQDCLAGERTSLHTQINHLVQQRGGGIPYPNAHSMPPAAVPKIQPPGAVGRRGRVLASQLADAQSMNFLRHELLHDDAVAENS